MKPRLTFLGAVSLVPLCAFALLMLLAAIAYFKTGVWPRFGHGQPQVFKPALFTVFFVVTILAVPVATCATCAFHGRVDIGSRSWHRNIATLGCLLFAYQFLQTGQWFFD